VQPSSSLPIPLTPAEIKKDNLQLTPNENLRLSYPWSDELLTLDLDGQVVIRARVLSSSSTNGNEPPPGFIRLKDHPAVASSFATSPPVTVRTPVPSLPFTFPFPFSFPSSSLVSSLLPLACVIQELRMWFGHTLVSNSEGVTVWDVRQAFVNSPVFVLSSSLPRLGRFSFVCGLAEELIFSYFFFGFGTDSLPLIITRMVSFFEESIPGSQKHGEFSCKFDASLFTLPFLSSSSFPLPFFSFPFPSKPFDRTYRANALSLWITDLQAMKRTSLDEMDLSRRRRGV